MTFAEAKFKLVESEVLKVSNPEYVKRSRSGHHTKSLDVLGDITKGVQVVYSDRFADLPVDQESYLREKLGHKFGSYFEQSRKLSLRDEAAADDDFIRKLLGLLGPEGFAKAFVVKVSLACKDDMDRRQFEIPEEVRLRAGIKQAKPGVKPIRRD
jgi:hypothetical protein